MSDEPQVEVYIECWRAAGVDEESGEPYEAGWGGPMFACTEDRWDHVTADGWPHGHGPWRLVRRTIEVLRQSAPTPSPESR